MSDKPKYYQIPKYDQLFTSEKQHDYCVAIFVINEGEKLHKQLQRMNSSNLNWCKPASIFDVKLKALSSTL